MPDIIRNIFVLLMVYQLKHLLADYFFQTKWMLDKFKPGWDFLKPLVAHCSVHAAATYFIACTYLFSNPEFDIQYGPLIGTLLCVGLAVFDFIVHFAMDRIKAGPKYLGRFKPLSPSEFMQEAKVIKEAEDFRNNPDKYDQNFSEYIEEIEARALKNIKGNTYFWWSLGLDQMVHHLTDIFVVYILVMYT